jgi:5-methyltetrahydropteroyltriglutamate--homocysteine methyltransferase
MSQRATAVRTAERALELPCRAEPVGSLLRPAHLLAARRGHQAGRVADEALRSAEDSAVSAAIAVQSGAGLGVVTDGEQRRGAFFDILIRASAGFQAVPGMQIVLHDDRDGAATMQCPVSVTGRIERRGAVAAAEYAYARDRSQQPVKVCLPSPFMLHVAWNPAFSPRAYPDPWQMYLDAADVLRAEVRDLARAGCRYIQIDAPELLIFWLNDVLARRLEGDGIPVVRIMHEGIDVLADIAASFPGIQWALHMCRGNGQSKWLARGGYENAARYLFPRARGFGRLLLEYDDDRSGGFAPLAYLPAGTVAVLGLVSTKRRRVEGLEEVAARLGEAARYADPGQLAVSTQCGFASGAELPNKVSAEVQRRKLVIVAEVARQVWA